MAGGERRLRLFIKVQQVVNLGRIVIFELIHLLLRQRPGLAQRRGGGMLRVFVQAFHAELRAVMVELAAEHVNVGRPSVKRVARRMNADERVAGLDPVKQPLRIGHRQFAGGADENHAVVILQRFRRQFLQRGLQGGIPLRLGRVKCRFLFVGGVASFKAAGWPGGCCTKSTVNAPLSLPNCVSTFSRVGIEVCRKPVVVVTTSSFFGRDDGLWQPIKPPTAVTRKAGYNFHIVSFREMFSCPRPVGKRNSTTGPGDRDFMFAVSFTQFIGYNNI